MKSYEEIEYYNKVRDLMNKDYPIWKIAKELYISEAQVVRLIEKYGWIIR